MMNREERRKYQKRIKHQKNASKCPKCGQLSLFYSVLLNPEAMEEVKEGETAPPANVGIKCEVCGAIVYEGEDVGKLTPPGIYIPVPLDVFDYALRHPELGEEEKEEKAIEEE